MRANFSFFFLLELGGSLYDIINHFKRTDTSYRFIKIAYSGKALFETPIVVYLKNLGLRLVFDSITQRLVWIEVVAFQNSIQFVYHAGDASLIVNKNGTEPLFKDIYNKIFGPTLPGKVYPQEKKYVLNYPGIAFSFPLSDELLAEFNIDSSVNTDLLSSEAKEKLIVLLSQSTLKCDAMILYNNPITGNHSSASWDAFYKSVSLAMFYDGASSLAFKKSRALGLKSITPSTSQYTTFPKKKTHGIISVAEIDLPRGLIRLNFTRNNSGISSFVLNCGVSKQQDILWAIGEPDATYLKIDSRYKIYNGDFSPFDRISKAKNINNEVFHNYFSYGFDLLYGTDSLNGAMLKKVVMHNNNPNSVEFNKYNKLNWVMRGNATSDSSLKDDFDVQEPNIFFPDFINRTNPTYNENNIDWAIEDSSNIATSEMYFHEIDEKNFKTLIISGSGTDIPPTTSPFNSSNFVLIDRSKLMSVVDGNDDSEDLVEFLSEEEDDDDCAFPNGEIGIDSVHISNPSAIYSNGNIFPRGESSVYGTKHERSKRKSSSSKHIDLKWGQSKLYGYNRCIWEVLSDNDAISSITLF
ncbi:hypothetical protein DASC09_020930 [Saccharomycopsis crataegensis]|uniref:Uncharacterized protein n=1 Tax=Saccharomycopsis crataegensis TaxID=43959 RepID=A0AAV5QKT2_9ASCO|nr:hypothetical protein DASC09_020930 [Saccharomycopsis crataegensis]